VRFAQVASPVDGVDLWVRADPDEYSFVITRVKAWPAYTATARRLENNQTVVAELVRLGADFPTLAAARDACVAFYHGRRP
jgi:hypothetical protein